MAVETANSGLISPVEVLLESGILCARQHPAATNQRALQVRDDPTLPARLAGLLWRGPKWDILDIRMGLDDAVRSTVVSLGALLAIRATLPVDVPGLDLQQIGSAVLMYLTG